MVSYHEGLHNVCLHVITTSLLGSFPLPPQPSLIGSKSLWVLGVSKDSSNEFETLINDLHVTYQKQVLMTMM